MKLLIVADSPALPSGFARVVQNLARRWRYEFEEIHFWAIAWSGYPGAPNGPRPWFMKEPFTMYPAATSGPWYSEKSLTALLNHIQVGKYTHIWIMQDSFLLRLHAFPEALRDMTHHTGSLTFLYLPVDAPLEKDWAEIALHFDAVVPYTEYGKGELLKHVEIPQQRLHVIPHGVDTEAYRSLPLEERMDLRKERSAGWLVPDDILLINVNQNQRRKDVVRSLEIIAGLHQLGETRFKLLMHMSQVSAGDDQTDLEVAGRQLGLTRGKEWDHTGSHFIKHLSNLPERELLALYNMADGYLTTSLGEGWGLGITEALACGLPIAVPQHTACEEIADRVEKMGMASSVIRLPVEAGHICLPLDNCRLRRRVDLSGAVAEIARKREQATFETRHAMLPKVAEWLSWGRIAADWMAVFRTTKKQAKREVAQ